MQQPPGWNPPPQQPGREPHNPYQPPAPYAQTPTYGQPNPNMDAIGLIAPVNVRNGLAFLSGYLGLGAFFCMGPILGIPAIITGALALKKPELGGQGRAWTGIIGGALGCCWGVVYAIWRFGR